ncbi:MAG: DUF4198 domain-containing protein [Xanthomonadales bacterium]|nr:DUF4198 domain-containing protein [Xanthomonadales bacterium]
MSKPLRVFALALAMALPALASAHKAFLVPSATVLSDGTEAWITVDAAVSNDLFNFNHVPLRVDALGVVAPDGSNVTPENVASGKYRSTFDLHLTQQGTYRIAVVNDGLMASYEDAAGKKQRARGRAGALDIPAGARNVEITETQNRIETFATLGKPEQAALKPTGKGLELAPVTHPNDLFDGEKASFRFLMDGKPAANVEVHVLAGGTRYRDRQDEILATTDADGAFSVTFPAPGLYWLNASVSDAKPASKDAKARRASYTATLEVLPQ